MYIYIYIYMCVYGNYLNSVNDLNSKVSVLYGTWEAVDVCKILP